MCSILAHVTQPSLRFWVDENWSNGTNRSVCRETQGRWSESNGNTLILFLSSKYDHFWLGFRRLSFHVYLSKCQSYNLLFPSLKLLIICWCHAASWHLCSGTFSSRSSKISLHCVNGRLRVQDWCLTTAPKMVVSFVQRFWLRDHSCSREGSQSAGQISSRNFCCEISIILI